jgi:hypothetical protein
LEVPNVTRYEHLFTEIDKAKPRKIMEIGTWDGEHARQMVERAKIHNPDVEYYGFDLFEASSILEKESQGGKGSPTTGRRRGIEEIQKNLEATGAKITLVKGDTNVTLQETSLPVMDFVFIDGGHSPQTIQNDWDNVQKVMGLHTVVIFDDYYQDDEKAGCKAIIHAIDTDKFTVEIMSGTDEFKKHWGILRINFVKVTAKGV